MGDVFLIDSEKPRMLGRVAVEWREGIWRLWEKEVWELGKPREWSVAPGAA